MQNFHQSIFVALPYHSDVSQVIASALFLVLAD
jgi:hypothetical protein